ncbi:MAG: MurR/RpiR family transcriptional regulator [Coprobacillaceae bacterium]
MIVLDKLKKFDNLSNNECIVARYLLDYKADISKLSSTEISKATYTSASTTIRLSKKLGYNGWLELRDAIHIEKSYLEKQTDDIDANFPFSQKDSIQKIVTKLEKLSSDTIHETASLIHHDELQKATMYLSNANRIYIFAMSNSATIAHDFEYKMRFLFKPVEIINNRDDFAYIFQTINKDDCCIFISYSGETFDDLQLTSVLKRRISPSISITGHSDNTLITCTDAHLYIPTKENRYSKIGPFISNDSIHYILDVLYACVFSRNYETNIDKRKTYIEETDYPNVFSRDAE